MYCVIVFLRTRTTNFDETCHTFQCFTKDVTKQLISQNIFFGGSEFLQNCFKTVLWQYLRVLSTGNYSLLKLKQMCQWLNGGFPEMIIMKIVWRFPVILKQLLPFGKISWVFKNFWVTKYYFFKRLIFSDNDWRAKIWLFLLLK